MSSVDCKPVQLQHNYQIAVTTIFTSQNNFAEYGRGQRDLNLA